MTLLDKIDELWELEKKATPTPLYVVELLKDWSVGTSKKHILQNDIVYTGEWDAKLFAALRNAAPDILDVLSGFLEGDGMQCKMAIAALEFSRRAFVSGGKTSDGDIDTAISAMRRFEHMARKMEQEES